MNETLIFMLVFVTVGLVFDFYIILKKGRSESISAHTIRLAYKYPLIPFLLGVLCGHFFWQMGDAGVWGTYK